MYMYSVSVHVHSSFLHVSKQETGLLQQMNIVTMCLHPYTTTEHGMSIYIHVHTLYQGENRHVI